MSSATNFMEKLAAAFNESAVEKKLSKGDFLVREGEVEKSFYLVTSGAIHVIYLTEFEEQTIRFGYEGSMINSLSSFIKGTASEFYIQAIRKTTVRILSKEMLMNLVHENEQSQRQYIILLENLVTQQIEREIDLLTTSPVERLNRVLRRSPNLFQHIPLKYIASYLRMKPETLSRIRNS